MKLMHTADWHCDRSNLENTEPAVDFMVEQVLQRRPGLFVHAGDLFHTRGTLDPHVISGVRTAFHKISRVCPVIIIPGNHDINYAWQEPDNVFATLSFMAAEHKIATLSWPQAVVVCTSDGDNIGLAAVPFPNKYLYLANKGEELARITTMRDSGIQDDDKLDMGLLMTQVVNGLKARLNKVAPGLPHVAVFHGTVVGGQADDESMLEPGNDIQVPGDVFRDFDVVMAGHLHRAQDVKGVDNGHPIVYSGSLSPFTHAQDGYKPSYCLWQLDTKAPVTNGSSFQVGFQRIHIPVACPRVTVDFDATTNPDWTPTQHALDALSMHTLSDCHVRLRGRILTQQKADWHAPTVVLELQQRGARSWKFDIQTVASVRLQSLKIRHDDDITDLMRRWTAIQPDDWPDLDKLQGFALQLEKDVQDRLKRLAPTVGYKTLAVSGENWKQHGLCLLPIQSLPRLVCLTGANGAGKSNAARLESFVLFGMDALNPGSKMADVVRHGCDSMAGWVHLETLDGKRYQVKRTVKIQKSGRAVSDLVLMKQGGMVPKTMAEPEKAPSYSVKDFEDVETWVPSNLANARETQHEIHRLVGHPDLYFRTRFARQGKVDAILEMTAKDLKTTIQEALNLASFDVRREAAKEKVKALKQNADSLAFAVDALELQLAEKPEVVNKHDSLADKLKGAEADVSKATEDRDGCRDGLQGAEADSIKLAGLAKTRSKLQTDLRILKDDRQKTVDDMQAFRDKVATLDRQEIVADLLTRDTAKEEMAAWATKCDQARDLQHSIDTAATGCRDEQRHGERDRQLAWGALDKAVKAADLVEQVPCEGKTWFAYGDEIEADMSTCQFLKDAIAQRDRIPALQTAVDKLDDQNARTKADGLETVRALHRERTAVGYDDGKHRSVTNTYTALVKAKLDDQLRALDVADSRTTELQKLVDNLDKIVARTQGVLDEIQPDLDGRIATNTSFINKEKAALYLLELAVGQAVEVKDSTVRLRGQLEGRLVQFEKAEKQAQDHTTNLEACRGELRLASAYHAAVDRDGIPFLLLEQAIPSLQNFVNEMLGDTDLTIEIDPARDLVSGKTKDEVTILFSDQNGQHVLAEASGGQRYLLGVPLRAAIANLEAERSGVQPQNFWIDEGFGSLDAENIQHARVMLEKLAARFERVIFITHVAAMAKSADATIEVLAGADGSLLELSTT